MDPLSGPPTIEWRFRCHHEMAIPFLRHSSMDGDAAGQRSLPGLNKSHSTYCARRVGHCWATALRICRSTSPGTLRVVWNTRRTHSQHTCPRVKDRGHDLWLLQRLLMSGGTRRGTNKYVMRSLRGTSPSQNGSTSCESLWPTRGCGLRAAEHCRTVPILRSFPEQGRKRLRAAYHHHHCVLCRWTCKSAMPPFFVQSYERASHVLNSLSFSRYDAVC